MRGLWVVCLLSGYNADAQRRYRNSEQGRAVMNRLALQRARERREWLNSLKEGKPCADCGQVYPPYVMDFDHRDPPLKTRGVTNMLMYSKERILAEIAKCDLVCANCHRVRTYGR